MQGGRLTSINKNYGIDSLEDALRNLDWKRLFLFENICYFFNNN
jgi:hypothetical protein